MSDAVPAWAYEKAEVLPHDPRFADRARAERDRLARSYADLKRRLAAQHAGDREAYTNAKAEFVAEALRRSAGS